MEEPAAEPKRVRRRRSSRRSRRPVRSQSRVPFTDLRFMRPRLPTPGQALGLAFALAALGVSALTIRVADQASVTLSQTRTLLAESTRGATAGRLAANQLVAQAQADAAQMMAAQDQAARQAARSAPGFGLTASDPYVRRSEEAPAEESRQASYGATYSGSPQPIPFTPYGGADTAPAATSGNVMGYTLPGH